MGAHYTSRLKDLLARGDETAAIQWLQECLMNSEDSLDQCVMAFELAKLFSHSVNESEMRSKAVHYAALAAEGFIRIGNSPEALRIYYWMKSFDSEGEAANRICRLFGSAFSQKKARRVSIDEEMPPPTPFQTLKGAVSLESEPSDMHRSQLTTLPTTGFSLFGNLRPPEVESLIQAGTLKTLAKGELLFSPGDLCKSFFIILDGVLKKTFEKKEIELKTEDIVGDLSFFSGRRHSSIVRAEGSVSLVEFEKTRFMECASHLPNLRDRFFRLFEHRLYLATIRQIDLFKGLDAEGLFDFFDRALPLTVPAGRSLVDLGKVSDSFYLVIHGTVEAAKDQHANDIYSSGDWLLLNEFLTHQPVISDWKCKSELYVLEWRKDLIQDFLNFHPFLKNRFQTPGSYSTQGLIFD